MTHSHNLDQRITRLYTGSIFALFRVRVSHSVVMMETIHSSDSIRQTVEIWSVNKYIRSRIRINMSCLILWYTSVFLPLKCLLFWQIFGPVQCVIKFKDINDAITKANTTHYGLAAGVITNDINKALTIANSVKGGSVWLVTSHQCFLFMTLSVIIINIINVIVIINGTMSLDTWKSVCESKDLNSWNVYML